MIFDSYDCEFMKLCGLCRYLPIDLNERFSSPVLSQRLKDNLCKQGLISIQNNGLSCKLTTAGKEILADMGYKFASDSRMNINSQGYRRKLINAKWNVLLYLAGINVYTKNVKELADNEQGYISSLMLRGDDKIRVLAGTRFHGLLKMRDAVYVPYHIEGSDDWIIPYTIEIERNHERLIS